MTDSAFAAVTAAFGSFHRAVRSQLPRGRQMRQLGGVQAARAACLRLTVDNPQLLLTLLLSIQGRGFEGGSHGTRDTTITRMAEKGGLGGRIRKRRMGLNVELRQGR